MTLRNQQMSTAGGDKSCTLKHGAMRKNATLARPEPYCVPCLTLVSRTRHAVQADDDDSIASTPEYVPTGPLVRACTRLRVHCPQCPGN